jgi:similar to stage IV sporulation protein
LRMWNFLTGYVIIRVEGLSLERFLNIAAENNVSVYDVRRASYTVLHATVSPRGLKKLQRAASESYTVVAVKSAGLTVGARWLARRKALLVGLVLVVLAAVVASLFVWQVRVTGVEYREAKALLPELEKLGIYQGAFKGNIDTGKAETKLIIAHDEFAWVNVRLTGVVARVEVVPAEPVPEMVDESRPCHIVAEKDAMIESVTALKGRPVAQPGDTVRAGDVLISGLVWDPGFPRMLFAARGKVIGNVWYTASAVAPVREDVRVPTGRTQTQRMISVGADSAPVDEGCDFAEYDTREADRYPVVGLFLPVYITALEHSEVQIMAQDIPRDMLKVYLEERAYYDAQGFVPEGAEIVGHRTIFKEEEGRLTATVYLQTQEDIGTVVYLED